MRHATEGQPADGFPVPGDIERVSLCRESHLLATEQCRLASASAVGLSTEHDGTYEELFAYGTAPRQPCPVHTAEMNSGEVSVTLGAAPLSFFPQ